MIFSKLLLLSLAIASISMTITKSNAMEWFRRSVSKLGSWVEELFHCPYCLSHWLATSGVFAWLEGSIIELMIYTMVVVTLSSLASLGIIHFFIALNALEEGSEE